MDKNVLEIWFKILDLDYPEPNSANSATPKGNSLILRRKLLDSLFIHFVKQTN